MDIVSSNPCDALERPRVQVAPPCGLTGDDIRRLLAVIPATPVGLRDRAIRRAAAGLDGVLADDHHRRRFDLTQDFDFSQQPRAPLILDVHPPPRPASTGG